MDQPELQRSAEVRPAEATLDSTVDGLRKRIGPGGIRMPDAMTSAENDKRRGELLRGGFDDASEVYEFGALRLEQQRLQMQKELSDGKAVDTSTLIAVSQGVAYHEYFPLLLGSLQESMAEYQAQRRTVPAAVLQKPSIARGEVAAQMTLAFLDEALAERVEFGNMLLLAQALRYGQKLEGGALSDADRAEYAKRLDLGMRGTKLRRDSLDVLMKKDEQAALEHANALNQRVLDVLSGKAGAVERGIVGFYPQALTLELLTSAYEHTLQEEKNVVTDPNNRAAEARIAQLEARAKENGGTLSKDEKEEYDGLAAQQRNRKGRLQDLKTKRSGYLSELLKRSDDLGKFQIRAEELTAIQRQFGRTIDPSAGPSNKQPVSEEVRQGIDRNMEERKRFHVDRIDAFLGTLEKEGGVLSIGAGERLEEFNNKRLRPVALKVVEALAGFASLPAPESFGLKKRIREAIAGDLEDAMGIPKRADGTPKDEKDWTREERATVEAKAKSVLDAINEFRYRNKKNDDGTTEFEKDAEGDLIEKDHVKKLRSTIGALRAMPPARTFVGRPLGGLPAERVDAENVDAMIARHGGPATYAKLMDQLLEDWGTVGDPPTGVIGESAEMMRKIDGVVGVHVDVAEAEIQLAADIADWLLYAAIALGAYVLIDVAYKVKKIFSRGGPSKAEVKALRKELAAATEENVKLRASNVDLKSLLDSRSHPSKTIGIDDGKTVGDAAGDARRSGVDVRTGADTDSKADVDAKTGKPKPKR